MNLIAKLTKSAGTAPQPIEKRSFTAVGELPENVRNALPPEAQEIWMRAYNWSYLDEDLNDAQATQSAWSEIRWSGYQQGADGNYIIAKRDDSDDFAQRVVKHASDQRYTLGIVYEPDVADSDGDSATAEEIEKAAHGFMRFLQNPPNLTKAAAPVVAALSKMLSGDEEEVQVDATDLLEALEKGAGLNDMHISTDADGQLGEIVECFVAPCDMSINGQDIKKGSWCMGVVWGEEHWDLIKSGQRTGFSMEGVGIKTPILEILEEA